MDTHEDFTRSKISQGQRFHKVKDFTRYGDKASESLSPENYDLYYTDGIHLKVIDLLDKDGFKPLNEL